MLLKTEPNYVIEIMLDAPMMEGIDRRTKQGKKLYKLVKTEAKSRGIRKGDYAKRMKSIRAMSKYLERVV
jgi:hypothetical protein